MTYPIDILESQASPEPVINANGRTVAWAATYGKNLMASAALSWAYFGGRWGGFTVADGTLTLAPSTTNYIVVTRSTGAIGLAANLAAYNDTASNARVASITTSAGAITAEFDDRAGPGGVHGGSAGGGGTSPAVTRASLGERVQALTDGASIAIDASLANNFRVVLGGNRMLANPTGLIDGQVLNFRLLQDTTGSRTLSYGTMFKFPGAAAPTLSTAASAIDLMSCQYDATDASLCCVLSKAFA